MSLAENLQYGWEAVQEFLSGTIFGIGLSAIVTSLLILLVGIVAVRYLAEGFRRTLRRAGVPPLVRRFLVRLSRFLMYVGVVGLALVPFGVNLTSLVIGFGVLGIIVGLALQDTLGNLVSGLLLLILRPFRKGELVEVAGITGFVEDLGLNATTLKTFDGRMVLVPSKKVWGGPITNFHTWPIRRIDLVVGIGYDDDVQAALRTVRAVLEGDDRILREPAPAANVREFADSSVNLNVFAWARQEDFGAVRNDLLVRIKEAFAREGITLPYPTRDLRFPEGSPFS